MKIDKEIYWPCMMLFGSTLNLIGSCAAISLGAHKTASGQFNPFFPFSGATSFIYAVGNAVKIYQIWNKKEPQEIDKVPQERDLEIGLSRSPSPELPKFDDRTLEMVRSSYRAKELARQNSVNER